ncbi:hypothetical protein M197_gp59 [Haloarcula hispanica tailed virus 2]|uniref:Uncharacterized protein n=1 Tax=Haloarcula hispanica tailed virus 2 TaxID=1273751 RepID=R4T6A7_9CAUD|nr:hypothetical protein M197_gp59 [Haloarcula hispanica tailed virus 2]AGM11224.1 hypothetical protein HHTV2_59 [Haloarcula hispanica tailed virus 2]
MSVSQGDTVTVRYESKRTGNPQTVRGLEVKDTTDGLGRRYLRLYDEQRHRTLYVDPDEGEVGTRERRGHDLPLGPLLGVEVER